MSVDFERLQVLEPLYEDNFETKRLLGGKVLTMLLGPTGAGKSTLIRQIEAFQYGSGSGTWGEPGSLTTRRRRPDDPASYKTADEGVTLQALANRIDDQTLTNFSVHPSGHLYATAPENFTYDYNVLPTLPSSVAPLRRAGFKVAKTAFVTVEPADLKHGLAARERDPSFKSRLRESAANITYALDHASEIHFVRNSHAIGGKEAAADELIDLTLDRRDEDSKTEQHVAYAMLKYVRERLDRL